MTYSFLSFLGTVSYRIRILMYLDVSCMYLDCILMCPVHIALNASFSPYGMWMAKYMFPEGCPVLGPCWCTAAKMRASEKGERDLFRPSSRPSGRSALGASAELRRSVTGARSRRPWWAESPSVACRAALQIHVSHMYPACIPHVSASHMQDTCILMYLICIQNLSWTRLGYV